VSLSATSKPELSHFVLNLYFALLWEVRLECVGEIEMGWDLLNESQYMESVFMGIKETLE